MYNIIDTLVKNFDSVYVTLFEGELKKLFLKDIKEAFIKEQNSFAKKLLILFLSWESYFSSDFLNKIVDKLYKESKKH